MLEFLTFNFLFGIAIGYLIFKLEQRFKKKEKNLEKELVVTVKRKNDAIKTFDFACNVIGYIVNRFLYSRNRLTTTNGIIEFFNDITGETKKSLVKYLDEKTEVEQTPKAMTYEEFKRLK